MRLLSALFDVVLVPVAVAKDAFSVFDPMPSQRDKSHTREKIEDIEDNLNRAKR